MPQGFEIRGMNALQRTLLGLLPTVRAEIKDITLDQAQRTVLDARANAPVDLGNLKRSIHFELTAGGLGYGVDWGVDWGAYAEFGTGGLVSVPSGEGWAELASEYKGNGVRKINRAPHPFLIPAFLINSDLYYQRIQDALNRLLR